VQINPTGGERPRIPNAIESRGNNLCGNPSPIFEMLAVIIVLIALAALVASESRDPADRDG
jgi:hypothetical protein